MEESGFFTCQCDVKINNIAIRVCIDSGCDDLSFMSLKQAKKLNLKLKKYDQEAYTFGVSGRTKTYRTCKTFIEFENIKIPITFEIGEQSSDILIG
ncbi:33473_t:CDS:1, partial [Gigaspora margarita]